MITRPWPRWALAALGRIGGGGARLTWPVRARLRRNLELALGEDAFEPNVVDRYFDRMSHWASMMLGVYHRGLAGSGAMEFIRFDDSVSHLDEAVKGGRGVVLAAPHFFLHEVCGGVIGTRHPLVAVVREQPVPSRQRRKEHWYRAVGMGTVWRPRKSRVVADMRVCLGVLRQGGVLAIAPDLVVDSARGVPLQLFGRRVHLMPGAVAIAQLTGAPLVTLSPAWNGDDGLQMTFSEPLRDATDGSRKSRISQGMQMWCDLFAERIQCAPEDWLFWLDKRWSKVFRSRRLTEVQHH